jgi:hypothetical protein
MGHLLGSLLLARWVRCLRAVLDSVLRRSRCANVQPRRSSSSSAAGVEVVPVGRIQADVAGLGPVGGVLLAGQHAHGQRRRASTANLWCWTCTGPSRPRGRRGGWVRGAVQRCRRYNKHAIRLWESLGSTTTSSARRRRSMSKQVRRRAMVRLARQRRFVHLPVVEAAAHRDPADRMAAPPRATRLTWRPAPVRFDLRP